MCLSEAELAKLAEVLNGAKKLTILGGAGCAGAHAELIELAGRRKAPIVHALRGKEFIEYDNPFRRGHDCLLGFASGYHAMMNCDVLLMLGTDFPYQQFFPPDATIIQIDIRGETARAPHETRLRICRRHPRQPERAPAALEPER